MAPSPNTPPQQYQNYRPDYSPQHQDSSTVARRDNRSSPYGSPTGAMNRQQLQGYGFPLPPSAYSSQPRYQYHNDQRQTYYSSDRGSSPPQPGARVSVSYPVVVNQRATVPGPVIVREQPQYPAPRPPYSSQHSTSSMTHNTLSRGNSFIQPADTEFDPYSSASRLTALGQQAARSPYGRYERCLDFIDRNPLMLADGEPEKFLAEAVRSLESGDSRYAKRCIQQALLINLCRDKERHEATIKKLQAKPVKDKEFMAEVSWVHNNLMSTIEDQRSQAPKQSDNTTIDKSLKALTISSRGREDLDETQSVAGSTKAQVGSHHRRSSDVTGNLRLSLSGRDMSCKYRVSSQPKEFFKVGKVFMVMWNDESSEKNRRDSSKSVADARWSRDSLDSDIVSTSVRRLIVIQEEQGRVRCVPIHTYDRHALNFPGLSRVEIGAHRVACLTGTEPQKLPTEPEYSNEAIRIRPRDEAIKLHFTSRINFSVVHKVPHYTKTRELGDVIKKDISYLLKCYHRYRSKG